MFKKEEVKMRHVGLPCFGVALPLTNSLDTLSKQVQDVCSPQLMVSPIARKQAPRGLGVAAVPLVMLSTGSVPLV